MDDWSDLDVFHAVAEEGSLAAAARRLKLSHPTVGRRLDALEARLGAPLLVRGASGVELTPTGASILDNVRRMSREADAIHRLAAAGDQGLAGVVSVSAVAGVGDTVLPYLLGKLRREHPDVQVSLDISTRAANLLRREADIGIRLGRPGEQASLVARRVAQFGLGFYAATAYLDAHGRPDKIADLAHHDALIADYELMPAWRSEVDGEIVEPRRIAFESLNPSALFEATVAGLGVGIHSHWRARGHPALERVLPQIEIPAIDLWAVTHADIKRNARIRVVFDLLADGLAANARYFRDGDPDVSGRFVAEPER